MASADTTRLLVLGVVQIFEPANGYQLRRELLSWEVDSWANVNPGSIYSMLTTLTKQRLVERVDLETSNGARPVAVYRMTDAGRTEFGRLVRIGITEVRQFDTTEFYAAMSLIAPFIERAEVVTLLGKRADNLRVMIARIGEKIAALNTDSSTPPHVAVLLGYAVAVAEAELAWIATFVMSVEAGGMVFAGEAAMMGWKPLDDDPAWRMVAERELYLKKIAEIN